MFPGGHFPEGHFPSGHFPPWPSFDVGKSYAYPKRKRPEIKEPDELLELAKLFAIMKSKRII